MSDELSLPPVVTETIPSNEEQFDAKIRRISEEKIHTMQNNYTTIDELTNVIIQLKSIGLTDTTSIDNLEQQVNALTLYNNNVIEVFNSI